MTGLPLRKRNLRNAPGGGDVMEGSSSSMDTKSLQNTKKKKERKKRNENDDSESGVSGRQGFVIGISAGFSVARNCFVLWRR